MARRLNGTTDFVAVTAGAFSGAGNQFTYGTMAAIVRRNSIGNWHAVVQATNAGTPTDQGFELATGDQVYHSVGGVTSTSTFTSTTTWYLLVLTKATGTATPRLHFYNYTSTTWTHEDFSGTAGDSGSTITAFDLGQYPGGDRWDGDIAAIGMFRAWNPNDAAVEAAGLHSAATNWVAAGANSDKEAVWLFNQASAATQLVDATGGGADETSSGIGTVVAGPAGYTETLAPPGPGEFVQDLGNQVTNTAATTTVISFTGATKPAVGDLVVMYGSRDNDASDALTGDSFSDGEGNTYTRVVAGANLGTANAGNVGVMFYSVLTAAWTGDQTLTWTHPSRKAAMRMEHWAQVASLRASGSNTATSTAGAPSVALTTPVTGDLVLAMESIEYSTAGTSTGDADTTNGSWSAVSGPTATTGTTLAACKVISQSKLVTGTGTQTYNPTHSITTNVDCVAIIAAFVPASAGATANLGTATGGVTANNLGVTRTLGTATATTAANGPDNARTLSAATATLAANNLVGTLRENLLFDSDRNGTNYELFRVTANGTVTQLTSNATHDSWWPRMSPDGTKILFVRTPAGVHDTDITQISTWTCNADGSSPTQILAAGVDGWAVQGHPAWKPDGTKIVTMGGGVDLYTCNPDGSGRAIVSISTHTFGLSDPQWSPDGATIVYCFAGNVWKVAASGGAATQLTATANDDFDPVISPDATTLAYLTHTSGNPTGDWDIRLQDYPAGTNDRELIGDGNINSRPEWAANSASVYFHRSTGGVFSLYNLTVPGAVLTAIATGGAGFDDEYPALLTVVTANLGTATVGVTANNVSGGSRSASAATVSTAATNLTGTARTITAATAATTASNFGTARTPTAATVTLTASNLAASSPSFIALGTATVATAASNLVGGNRTPTAATAAATAADPDSTRTVVAATTVTTTANNLAASAPVSLPLGTATAAVAASNLSSTRTAGTATTVTTANPAGYTARPVLAAATITATGYDAEALSLGAEPLGSGRTPSPANATLVASPQGYTDRLTPAQASVAVTASLLGRSDITQAAAAVSVAANNLADALTAQAAAVTVTANNLNAGVSTLGAASSTTAAFNLLPNLRTLSAATAALVANPLGVTSPTLAAATAALTAAQLGFNALTPAAAAVATTANPLSVGETLAAAQVATLAYNLGFTSQPTLTAATVALQAQNLFLNPTSTLGSAAAAVDAYSLNAVTGLGTALATLAAQPLAGTRQTTAAQASLLASNLADLRGAALAAAVALVDAYGLTTLSLGQSPLGHAPVVTSTFNLFALVLFSAGHATVTLAATPLTPQHATQGAQAAATTAASPLATQRTAPAVQINIAGHGFGRTADLTTTPGTVTVGAYGLQNSDNAPPSGLLAAVAVNIQRNEIAAAVGAGVELMAEVR